MAILLNTLLDKYIWSTSPTGYCTVTYEYKREGASMLYRFAWKVWLHSSSWYYDAMDLTFILDSNYSLNVTVKGYNANETGWSYSGTTDWITVPSKTSGTTSVSVILSDTSRDVQKMKQTSTLYVSPASSVLGTITSFDVDGNITIPITKYSTSITDELKIKCGNTLVKTISSITNGAIVNFTTAEKNTIYSIMSAVNSTLFTFELTSYEGATSIGSSTKSVYGSISNALPIFDDTQITWYDGNGATTDITKNNQYIVQNKSTLYVNLPRASGNKGASIISYQLTIGEHTVSSSSHGEKQFGTINANGNVSLFITIVDSRSNKKTVEKVINVIEYKEPIVAVNLYRKNNYEDETHFKVNATYSSVEGVNSVGITYKYAEKNDDYGNAQSIANGTEYIFTCNKSKVYKFYVTVTDVFGTTVTKEIILSKGEFPLFIDTQKNAVGINSFPDDGEALHVDGGVGYFEDGIVIKGTEKKFLLTVDDEGNLLAVENASGEGDVGVNVYAKQSDLVALATNVEVNANTISQNIERLDKKAEKLSTHETIILSNAETIESLSKKVNDIDAEWEDTKGTVSALNTKVQETSNKVDGFKQSIESKAEQTQVDAIEKEQNSQATRITNNATAISNLDSNKADNTALSQTNGNLSTLQGRVDGHDTDIGALEEDVEVLEGNVANLSNTKANQSDLNATNTTVNNLSTEVGTYSQRITDVEADIGQLQDEKLDKSDIGSQHVNSATHLISESEYGVQTDQYGNLHQIKDISGACWQVLNVNGTAMLSVFFDGSGARVGTNGIIHSGNIGSQNVAGAKQLNNFYSSRPTSANIPVVGDGSMKIFKATGSMTEGNPVSTGSNIMHFEWDNIYGYSSQLAVPNASFNHLEFRGMQAGTWGDWVMVVDSNNFKEYIAKYLNETYFTKGY